MKSSLQEEQIIGILKEHQAGLSAAICAASTASVMPRFTNGDQVWWHGDLRRPEVEGFGGRKPAAEEAAGGNDAGCGDAKGDAGKKLLTPSVRRRP